MDLELIEFVKNNPVLYEKQYCTTKCKQVRMQKWNELAKKLKRDPNVLRLRWKSMRDNYRKFIKSNESRDALEVNASGNKSKYYSHLTFLNSQFDERQDYDSDPEVETQDIIEEVSYDIEPLDIKTVEFEDENFDLNQYLKKHDATLVVTAEDAAASDIVFEKPITNQQSKKKRITKDDVITEACEEMSALLQGAKEHFTPPTHNQIFFNSLALQVEQAQMPAMEQMRLQQKILELITQELVMYQEQEQMLLQQE